VSFECGDVVIMVVIDVVVCGIDVEWIVWVINFDMFGDHDVYIYCVGCIGCVGCDGIGISFVFFD